MPLLTRYIEFSFPQITRWAPKDSKGVRQLPRRDEEAQSDNPQIPPHRHRHSGTGVHLMKKQGAETILTYKKRPNGLPKLIAAIPNGSRGSRNGSRGSKKGSSASWRRRRLETGEFRGAHSPAYRIQEASIHPHVYTRPCKEVEV